jgi:ribosomal protein L7Ae-like RNA K-turn-binding protein
MQVKERMARAPKAEVAGLLGLARRAGAVVLGVDGVRRALREGRARLVILSGDAAPGQLQKLEGILAAGRVPVRWVDRRETLARAVGRSSVSAIAVTTRSFAEQLLSRLPASSLKGAAPEEVAQGSKEESGTDAGR